MKSNSDYFCASLTRGVKRRLKRLDVSCMPTNLHWTQSLLSPIGKTIYT